MYYRELRNDPLESFEEYDFSYDQEKQCRNLRDNISDTIVFHPDDPTTDFLDKIYEGKLYDVVNDPYVTDEEVRHLIHEHDRVICLGHGSPDGLFGMFGMLINDSHADILKDKDVVAIWCHANQFMQKNGLKGFYTGMFISEVMEASLYGIGASHQQIQQSNRQFAVALGKYIDEEEILPKVKSKYKKKKDPVVAFNRERLYRKK
jgi:hypothetical protein